MISNSGMGSCPNEEPTKIVDHRRSINPFNHSDDGGNQSDSSNSTSSLASSPRYNERYPKTFENFRKTGGGGGRNYGNSGGSGGGGNSSSSSRGSFAVLGSRTSLPPLDENCTLDATESQLSLQLRRATRSSSWTNQKILDAIDGIKTSIEDLDPCLVIGGKVSSTNGSAISATESSSKTESSRQGSLEKFVIPKSISNLIMKSRSSGSVNPPTSAQNRENSCYNFLCGIREDEDEEQHQQDDISTFRGGGSGGTTTTTASADGGGEIRLTITPASSMQNKVEEEEEEGKYKHFIAKGSSESEKIGDNLLAVLEKEANGTSIEWHSKNGNVTKKDDIVKKKALTQQEQHQQQQHQHQPQDRNFPLEKVILPCSTLPQPTDSSITDDADKEHQWHHQQQHQHHHHHQNSKNIVQSQSKHCTNTTGSVSDKREQM